MDPSESGLAFAALGEDLVLLSIRPRDGKLMTWGRIDLGLMGSELVRLAAAGRAGITGGRITVLDPTPTGDTELDAALLSLIDARFAPRPEPWVGLPRRASAFRQETPIRAPPSSDTAISQLPRVDRTTESAMANPRPVPATASLARWKRSNTASRWSSGIPGPESSTRSSTRPPALRTLTSTRLACPERREVDWLVPAQVPLPAAADSASPLLSALARKGWIRPSHPGSSLVPGVDVDRDQHPLAANGQPNQRIWVLGPLCEGATFYNNLVPSPGVYSRPVADAHRCAAAMLAAPSAASPRLNTLAL